MRGNAEPLTPGSDLIIGRTVLGNYRVERKIGQGGMGSVYLAQHTVLLNTFVALKVLGRDGRFADVANARFKQEAMIAAAVGNHRVVRPIEIGSFDDGIPYIVMEYVAGRTLVAELSTTGPLEVARALKIAWRIADTLAIAHAQEILHRDIKPSNIMLAREGGREEVVKLFDFGVARATGDLKLAETKEDAIVGTPGYISPEAIDADQVDGKTDVFSLGATLYEMLTGDVPFRATTFHQAIGSLLTRPLPTVASRRAAHLDPASAAVEEIVKRALAKEAAERYTMAELRDALGVALDQGEAVGPGTIMSVVAAEKSPVKSTVARKRPLTAAAAVAAVLAGGALAWWTYTRPARPRVVTTTPNTTPTAVAPAPAWAPSAAPSVPVAPAQAPPPSAAPPPPAMAARSAAHPSIKRRPQSPKQSAAPEKPKEPATKPAPVEVNVPAGLKGLE